MNIYIYPKGKNGETLYEIAKQFYPSSNIVFIDDSNEKTNLQSFFNTYKSGKIFIATKKNYKRLAKKLEDIGIKNYEDGITFFAKKLDSYLQKKIKKEKGIGILLRGLSSEKHIGKIDIALKKQGFDIFYICESEKVLNLNKEKLKDETYLVAAHDILAELKEYKVFITTNGGNTHDSIVSVDLRHAFCEPLHFPYLQPQNYNEVLDSYMQSVDYICTTCKNTYEVMEKNLSRLNKKPKLLKAGSLSLDSYINEVNSFNSEKKVSKKVILAVKDIFNKREVINLCYAILNNGFELLFRTHPDFFYSTDALEIKKEFEKFDDFSFDTDSSLSIENRINSLCLITDYSSLGYTYPLSTKHPAIIYSPFKEEKKIHGYGFFDCRLHLKANSIEDVINSLKRVDENIEVYKQSILEFLDKDVFNLLQSEEYIINEVKNIMNRENND